MGYKDSLLYQGRHRQGNFELTERAREPAAVIKPSATPPPVPIPRPAPPALIRMGQHRVPPKIGTSERRPVSPIDPAPLPREDAYVPPDDLLTGLQIALLAALDARAEDIGSDILLEAKNVVRRNLSSVSIVPTASEKRIFEEIGVPGF